jgi:hypothetical protein
MPMESTIDALSGQVKVRYTDEDGKEKVIVERLQLPAGDVRGWDLRRAEDGRSDRAGVVRH